METAVTLPVTRFAALLPAVEARVGQTTGTWLIDTGAGITCVDRETARAEGLEGWGRLVGHRMTGERVDLARVEDVTLEVGGRTLHHETLGLADLSAFLPPEMPPLSGVLGLASFAALPITLDLPADRLHLETEASLSARTRSWDELTVRVARSLGGLSLDLFVAVESRRGSLFFEVDSACTGPVVVAPHAAEALGLPETTPGSQGEGRLPLRGTDPIATPWVVEEIIHDGVIGLSVWNERALALDLRATRAHLARA